MPHYAMSGGALIALAADDRDEQPCRSWPGDPQLGQFQAVSSLKTVEDQSKDKPNDETLILADQAKNKITQVDTKVRPARTSLIAVSNRVDIWGLMTKPLAPVAKHARTKSGSE